MSRCPRVFVVLMAVATLGAAASPVAAQTPVKFALDWALQGNHSVWTMAQDRGHFAREGLNVTTDRGFGSGDTVTKVASGAYDMGFADINALVPFNAQNPNNKVIGVFIVFDQSLGAVIARKGGPIASPKDLEGKKLGAPEGEASRLLFPAFARANGVDASKIIWQNVTPQLRETMLAQRQVDAITGFVSTGVFNLKAAGIDPADLLVFRFNDYGVDILGSSLIVTQSFAERNPNLVRGFVRATIDGLRDALADPKTGMAQLKRRDALLNEALELERWELVKNVVVLTPNVRERGFSVIDPARLARAVRVVAEAYNVVDKITPADIYTDRFLPPVADLRVTR